MLFINRKVIPLLCSLALSGSIFGQTNTYVYKPLEAKGPIAEDFRNRISEKVIQQQAALEPGMTKAQKRNEITFHQFNEYYLDAYLTNGNVLYGDEITRYLNDVLDVVLAKEPELRKEMRIYTVRSDEFNAYTTNNGIIFVNVGLLAQLQTEAQLAYVLSHEIVHYAKKHVRKTIDLEAQLRILSRQRGSNADELEKKYYDYSKENELESDREGYERFYKKSGYNFLAPFELMDIMVYAYLPFDEVPFDFQTLFTKDFQFEQMEFLKWEGKPITAIENVPDSLSSHPNIKQRRQALKAYATVKKEGADFLVSKERFESARALSRYTCLAQYLSEARYDRAIYQAFLLSEEHNDILFLEQATAYAVYGTSVYANHNVPMHKITAEVGKEGELSRVEHALKNMMPIELNTLAVAKTYEFYKKHPNDPFGKLIFEEAVWELVNYHGLDLSDFTVAEKSAENQAKEDSKATPELNTGRKVKRLKEEKATDEDNELWRLAFSGYLNDTLFTSAFKHQVALVEQNKKQLPYIIYNSSEQAEVSLKEYRDTTFKPKYAIYKWKNKVGQAPLTSTYLLTPKAYKLNTKAEINFKVADENRDAYIQRFVGNTAQLGCQSEILDYKYLEADNAARFNMMQQLQMWYGEHLTHGDVRIIPYCTKYTSPIVDSTGIENLMFGVSVEMLSMEGPVGFGNFTATYLLGFAYLPMFPVTFAQLYLPGKYILQLTNVVNIKTRQSRYAFDSVQSYRTNAVTYTLEEEQLKELLTNTAQTK